MKTETRNKQEIYGDKQVLKLRDSSTALDPFRSQQPPQRMFSFPSHQQSTIITSTESLKKK